MPNDPSAAVDPGLCTFRYPMQWSDFFSLAFRTEDLPNLERFVEILEFRDRKLEDHLDHRPCAACYAMSAYMSALQSIPDSTDTALTFDTMEINCGGTLAANQITIGFAGDYLVGGNVRWQGNVTGARGFHLYRTNNGQSEVIVADGRSAPSSTAVLHCAAASRIVSLAVGDILSMDVYQNSGGALNVFGGSSGQNQPYPTYLWAVKVCGCGTPIPYPGGGG